jgi:hypothetical protein
VLTCVIPEPFYISCNSIGLTSVEEVVFLFSSTPTGCMALDSSIAMNSGVEMMRD